MGFDPVSFLISLLVIVVIQIIIALLTPKPKTADDRSNIPQPTNDANTPRWVLRGQKEITPALIAAYIRPYEKVQVDAPTTS